MSIHLPFPAPLLYPSLKFHVFLAPAQLIDQTPACVANCCQLQVALNSFPGAIHQPIDGGGLCAGTRSAAVTEGCNRPTPMATVASTMDTSAHKLVLSLQAGDSRELLRFITRLPITRSDSGLIGSVVASIINNTALPAGLESNAKPGDGDGGGG